MLSVWWCFPGLGQVTTEWLGCQRNWMYLQPIFDSEDIQRQLPAEAKRFNGVDRQWRKTLDRVTKTPEVITFCDDDELLEQWIKSNNELERVQKNLADYLETKRAVSTRPRGHAYTHARARTHTSHLEALRLAAAVATICTATPHGTARISVPQAFARFYFLSNDELISILSQTKDPNAVQPHLRKCFEAVHAITMTVRIVTGGILPLSLSLVLPLTTSL